MRLSQPGRRISISIWEAVGSVQTNSKLWMDWECILIDIILGSNFRSILCYWWWFEDIKNQIYKLSASQRSLVNKPPNDRFCSESTSHCTDISLLKFGLPLYDRQVSAPKLFPNCITTKNIFLRTLDQTAYYSWFIFLSTTQLFSGVIDLEGNIHGKGFLYIEEVVKWIFTWNADVDSHNIPHSSIWNIRFCSS